MKVKYDNKNECAKCGGNNIITVVDTILMTTCECRTECEKCSHKDYWAYGWFESKSEPPDSYYNKKD